MFWFKNVLSKVTNVFEHRNTVAPERHAAVPSEPCITAQDDKETAMQDYEYFASMLEKMMKNKPAMPVKQNHVSRFEENKRND